MRHTQLARIGRLAVAAVVMLSYSAVFADIFTDPSLKIWLNADNLALSQGEAVSNWTNIAPGAGVTVTQANADNQPTYTVQP